MTLVYYNALSDAVYIIESNEGPSLGIYYVLTHKNNQYGWICLGEL